MLITPVSVISCSLVRTARPPTFIALTPHSQLPPHMLSFLTTHHSHTIPPIYTCSPSPSLPLFTYLSLTSLSLSLSLSIEWRLRVMNFCTAPHPGQCRWWTGGGGRPTSQHPTVLGVHHQTLSFVTITTTACPNQGTSVRAAGGTGLKVGPLGTYLLAVDVGRVVDQGPAGAPRVLGWVPSPPVTRHLTRLLSHHRSLVDLTLTWLQFLPSS